MLYSHNSLATSFVCGVLPYYSIMRWRQLLWWVWIGPYGSHVTGLFLSTQVFSVDWSPDGERVASGGRDRVLKM